MKQGAVATVLVASLLALLAASCSARGPERTCRVNGQCFVCPDAQAKSRCLSDPTASRCKWAEPGHCM